MKVIVISEDCHGFIGLADTLEHAIDFLMDEGWLDEGTTIPVFNEKTKEWEEISINLGLSVQRCYDLHDKALKALLEKGIERKEENE